MEQRRTAPGPKGQFLLGSLPQLNRDILALFDQLREEYGDVIHLRLAHKQAHVVCHPAQAEQALIRDTDSIVKIYQIKEQKGLGLVLGKGLIPNYGEHWRRQRELINPMFRPRVIEGMATTMIGTGEQLLARLADDSRRGVSTDIWSAACRTAVEAALATMFGENRSADDADELSEAMAIVMRFCFDTARNPLMPPLTWPTPRNRQFHKSLAVVDDYLKAIIDRRRAETTPKDDLLGLLIDATDNPANEQMTPKQLRDEVATTLLAGHETSASALTSALVQIASRPQVVHKIRQELADVVGDEALSAQHLRRLPYMQAVVQETLRLWCPVPVINRVVIRDTTLGGYHIPAGSALFISVHNIHRHPDIWRNPLDFDPDRFVDGSDDQRPRCSFLPFGAGERFCLGSNFASIELSILLAQIVGTFDFRITSDVDYEVAVTRRPTHPIYMAFSPVSKIEKEDRTRERLPATNPLLFPTTPGSGIRPGGRK